jgi:hypothetical protein
MWGVPPAKLSTAVLYEVKLSLALVGLQFMPFKQLIIHFLARLVTKSLEDFLGSRKFT